MHHAPGQCSSDRARSSSSISAAAANHVPPFAMLLTLVWVLATGGVLAFRRREPAPVAAAAAA